jgi:hypothetical protein
MRRWGGRRGWIEFCEVDVDIPLSVPIARVSAVLEQILSTCMIRLHEV